jgi:hypothetical protein
MTSSDFKFKKVFDSIDEVTRKVCSIEFIVPIAMN